MDIILIRHAKADAKDASRYPDDDLRPLVREGREVHRLVARTAKRMGIRFDVLVTSPLVRAKETAEITAQAYGWTEAPREAPELGHGFSVAAVLKLLATFPPDARVALVGHEPDFSTLAAALLSPSAAVGIVFKKSGIMGIGFDAQPAAGAGVLLYHLRPSHLKKLSA